MRQIIDETNVVFAKAAAAVAALVERKPDAVIGITEVDMPETFFAALRDSGVSFANVTFCNACELSGEAGQGAQAQAAKLQALLYDAVQPGKVLLPTMEDYDAAIRAAGGMDLVILGIGERGHIAYDEPGVDFGSGTHENKLADVTRNALAEYSSLCATLGREVEFTRGGRRLSGAASAVNALGELVVNLPDNTELTVNAGEVTAQGIY